MHSPTPAPVDRAFCASAAAQLRRAEPEILGCEICDCDIRPTDRAVPMRAGLGVVCWACAHTCTSCGCSTVTSVVESGGLCGCCDAALDDVLAATGAGPEVLAS